MIAHFHIAEPAEERILEALGTSTAAAIVHLEHPIAALGEELRGERPPLPAHTLHARATINMHDDGMPAAGVQSRRRRQPVVQPLAIFRGEAAELWWDMAGEERVVGMPRRHRPAAHMDALPARQIDGVQTAWNLRRSARHHAHPAGRVHRAVVPGGTFRQRRWRAAIAGHPVQVLRGGVRQPTGDEGRVRIRPQHTAHTTETARPTSQLAIGAVVQVKVRVAVALRSPHEGIAGADERKVVVQVDPRTVRFLEQRRPLLPARRPTLHRQAPLVAALHLGDERTARCKRHAGQVFEAAVPPIQLAAQPRCAIRVND